MRIVAEIQDDWLGIVHLTGELDAYSGVEFREVIDTLIGSGTAFLLIDCAGLEYIDSVGLGILMGAAKRTGQMGGEIAVVCSRPNICRVFNVSGTGELLNVRADMEQAREALQLKRSRQGGEPTHGC